MPQKVLDHLRVRAAREQQGGARVAEVVQAYLRQSGSAEQGLEVPVHDVLRVQRSAFDRGEVEIVFLPLFAGPKLLL